MVFVAKIATSDPSEGSQAAQAYQDDEDRQKEGCNRPPTTSAKVCALLLALRDARLRQTTVVAAESVTIVALLAPGRRHGDAFDLVAFAVDVTVAELVGIAAHRLVDRGGRVDVATVLSLQPAVPQRGGTARRGRGALRGQRNRHATLCSNTRGK